MDLEDREADVGLGRRAMRALAMQGDENIVADAKGGWSRLDSARGDSLDSEGASDTAEVVAVEKISFAVLAERKNQRLIA